ncbi:MAG: PDR/VanB family oxidoreductase [Burkholderiales bacterium]
MIPDPQHLTLVVAGRSEVASGIVEFELRVPGGGPLPVFQPGSHLTVETPSGVRRKYSIVNPPSDAERYCIAVKREAAGRGGSRSMHDDLAVGAALKAEAPDNAFALVSGARRHVFIAGGIGITPILCMVRSLIADADAAGEAPVPFKLYYLTRDAAVTAYRDEIAALAERAVIHHDGGDPAAGLDLWPVLEKPAAGTHVYCCGPRPLMDAVRDMAGHWSSAAIHFESFGAGDASLFEPDQAFEVLLARAQVRVGVTPGQTILEALGAHGAQVRRSCEAGSCGSCRTTYLSGDVEHRDLVLAEDEKATQMMVCVSRARGGELVLDL